jgi:hypothetical protein
MRISRYRTDRDNPVDLSLRQRVKVLVLIAGFLPALAGAAQAPGASAVPDFSGFWQHGIGGIEYIPPESGPGPVMDVARKGGCPPAGDRDTRPRSRSPLCGARTAGLPFVGDLDNPNLKPATREAIRRANAKWLAGEEVNTASSMCLPSGVPRILGVQAPLQILQAPNEIVMLHQRDDQVRRIHLNQPHVKDPKPSWYGDSVGHYEGDTLVVDTIAQNDKSVLDYFGTPHSTAMRVIERYRMINNGRTLEVRFTVEDPNAFNMPWSAILEYQRSPATVTQLTEERCAENNRGVETPTDDTPDF